jgi:hypothetical protein
MPEWPIVSITVTSDQESPGFDRQRRVRHCAWRLTCTRRDHARAEPSLRRTAGHGGRFDERTWAIRGSIAYEGEVILAEFDTREVAMLALERLVTTEGSTYTA